MGRAWKLALKNSFYIISRLPLNPRVLLGFFIALLVLTLILTANMRALILLNLPHTSSLDLLYHWLDPFFLWLVSCFSVMYLLVNGLRPSKGSLTPLNRILLNTVYSIAWLIISLMFLRICEVEIAKPLFRKLRPYEFYQSAVLRDVYFGKDSLPQGFDLDPDLFSCPTVRDFLENQQLPPLDSQPILNIKNGVGMYDIEISLEDGIGHLQRIKDWYDKDITLWLTDLIIKDSPSHENDFDQLDSMPSGNVLRQVFVFLLAVMIYSQSTRKKALFLPYPPKSSTSRATQYLYGLSLVLVNGAILLVVMLSRVYGYQHNAYEVLLSLNAGLLFGSILLFSLSWTEKQDFVDSLPKQVFEVDKKGLIRRCNERLVQCFGADSIYDILWTNIRDYWVFNDQRVNFFNALREIGSTSKFTYVAYCKRKNGEHFFAEIEAAIMPDSAVRGIADDITEKYNSLQHGYFRIDYEFRLTYCNHEFLRIIEETSADDVIYKTIMDLLEGQVTKAAIENNASCVICIERSDGKAIRADLSLYRLKEEASQYHSYEGTLRQVLEPESPQYLIEALRRWAKRKGESASFSLGDQRLTPGQLIEHLEKDTSIGNEFKINLYSMLLDLLSPLEGPQ